ncbi:hypothetical protein ACI797_23405 [Geodermatophilus sp. SYSU D00691]
MTPEEIRRAADRVEEVARQAPRGDWRVGGLLASRPEVVAHRPDGATEHVAEVRARSARWIVGLSPAVAGPLAAWLRSAARSEPVDEAAVRVARVLLERLG